MIAVLRCQTDASGLIGQAYPCVGGWQAVFFVCLFFVFCFLNYVYLAYVHIKEKSPSVPTQQKTCTNPRYT